MASASPRLPQALTPPPLGGLGAHGYQRVYWVLASPPIIGNLSCCLDRYHVRNHRECCICACIWAWEVGILGPYLVPATSPKVKCPILQRRTSPARTTRSCGASSCTRTQETRLTSRTTEPVHKTPNLARIFKAPHPRKSLLSPPKKCIFVTVTKVIN